MSGDWGTQAHSLTHSPGAWALGGARERADGEEAWRGFKPGFPLRGWSQEQPWQGWEEWVRGGGKGNVVSSPEQVPREQQYGGVQQVAGGIGHKQRAPSRRYRILESSDI